MDTIILNGAFCTTYDVAGRFLRKKEVATGKKSLLPPFTLPFVRKDFVAVQPLFEANNNFAASTLIASRSKTDEVLSSHLAVPVGDMVYDMQLVKGGEFRMSDTYKVVLTDYYIGKFLVTQALWTTVMGSNPSFFKGDNLPVENVSWDLCQQFVAKINALSGRQFALPTDAQWAFAAQGGTMSKGYVYAGSDAIDVVAEYRDNNNQGTKPVGSRQPNELGLYDMSGNVWEWCSDWYASLPSGSATDPVGPSTGRFRVLRGGSWHSSASRCRVTRRLSDGPNMYDYNVGLRLVLAK